MEKKKRKKQAMGIWGLGIGDWGLGIGDWANPQSPIPNPQSPFPNPQASFFIVKLRKVIYFKIIIIKKL
jgi:hypothetical protein